MPHREKPLLDGDKVVETIAVLQRRISERFPESGLSTVAGRLHHVARRTRSETQWLAEPIVWVRVLAIALTSLLVAGIVIAFVKLVDVLPELGVIGAVETIEAAVNDAVFVGIAVVFAWSLEVRMKRNRALAQIHQLRSLAHIIDMHQLTKDPERLVHPCDDTESSPERTMTHAQLDRYLDYCSEMLSLTGKVAVLYIQDFDDATVLASANEVEILTTGLSQKVWQKLMILNAAPAA